MTFQLTTTEKIMGGVIIGLLVLFAFKECGNQKNTDNLLNNSVNYKDSAEFYKVKVNGKQVEIAYNQSLVLEDKKQLEAMVKKNDTLAKLVSKFKSVQSTTTIVEHVSIKHDTIRLTQQIPCNFSPIKIVRDSVYYHFKGTISPNYFTIDSLTIPNSQSIVIGNKKLGFLKGTEQRVEIINSNPLMKTTNIGNFIVSKPKKWFERPSFWGVVGLVAGGLLVGTHK